MDQETARRQARDILESFSKALEGIKTEEARVERLRERRKEGLKKAEIDRKIMFENAPKTKGECIEAERGAWT